MKMTLVCFMLMIRTNTCWDVDSLTVGNTKRKTKMKDYEGPRARFLSANTRIAEGKDWITMKIYTRRTNWLCNWSGYNGLTSAQFQMMLASTGKYEAGVLPYELIIRGFSGGL